ncbi:hypothetical protein WR25_02899 [Diploscapter pachys]|uniref:Glycosyl transferase family 51 domain-containing protein n=1 Tax=Diploscapter pachys TaxID=2018661 RepID=A0A2A2M3W7_9BILA|nr:hypothetical protein WR25_02899 [Diploscapter pachys]
MPAGRTPATAPTPSAGGARQSRSATPPSTARATGSAPDSPMSGRGGSRPASPPPIGSCPLAPVRPPTGWQARPKPCRCALQSMASDPPRTSRFTAFRDAGGVRGLVSRSWGRWWVKGLAILAVLAVVGYGVLWVTVLRQLPSVDQLRSYEPPLPTNVRGADGAPIQSYARERRVELSYAEYPPLLVRAFLAAEDKTFFEHHGVDYPGLGGAVIDYVRKFGTGRRAKGGSTITQQVAKNLLIGNEYSPTRKFKEAILAYKIEDTLTKPQILELRRAMPISTRN